MIRQIQHQGLRLLKSEHIAVPHGSFTRYGGCSPRPWQSLNCSFAVGDDPANVQENRIRMKGVLGCTRLVSIRQVHGDRIVRVGTEPFHEDQEEADAMVTDRPGMGLLIQQADCQAVLLYDPVHNAIGAVHSGWRGSVANIAAATVQRMRECFRTRPKDLRAMISPSLGPCCAEFVNYRTELPQELHRFRLRDNHFDFWAITRWQLRQAGLAKEYIHCADICTVCTPDFFSYRRSRQENTATTGRCGSIICLPGSGCRVQVTGDR